MLGTRVVIFTFLLVAAPSVCFHLRTMYRRCSSEEKILHRGTVAAVSTAHLIEASGRPTWDAAAGVWVNKADGNGVDIPSPLWIFGYGSLCWRPEVSFEGSEKLDGEIVGWKRLFAQKSMDHRGTPEFPGLVATAVADADLEALGLRSPGDPPSRIHGMAYRVPDDKAEEVLAGLDFRERGGYTRAIVDVYPVNGSREGESVEKKDRSFSRTPTKALLYTASVDNPNFFLADSVEEAAAIIASAVGPSGPNHEYLLFLWEYLEKVRGKTGSATA